MGRTKKVAFTVVAGTEQVSCRNERELLDTLASYEDLSDILVFAGAPLTVERSVTFALNSGAAKRGPGRPPGSKAKRKAKSKGRGPGRPKGSKNKKQKAAPAPKAGKKRPGRPKGSKNKKPQEAATVGNIVQQAAQGALPIQALPVQPQPAAPTAVPAADVTK